jgi:hypothetical protein
LWNSPRQSKKRARAGAAYHCQDRRPPQPQLTWRRTREPDGANVLIELSSGGGRVEHRCLRPRRRAGNLDARAGSKLQDRAGIEPGQMNMPRRDVLAEVSGREAKSERVELKDEFLFHEMDLPCYVITGKVSHVVVPSLELS